MMLHVYFDTSALITVVSSWVYGKSCSRRMVTSAVGRWMCPSSASRPLHPIVNRYKRYAQESGAILLAERLNVFDPETDTMIRLHQILEISS